MRAPMGLGKGISLGMDITYIFHSGFAVEAEQCVLVFDYWMDPSGALPPLLSKGKPTYVFVSHFHEDHFTKEILTWRAAYPTTAFTYILSKDVLRHRRAKEQDADVWMAKGAEWHDERISVRATGSTDSGVSWVVEVEGKRLFHAGDLNNWYARFLMDDFEGGTIMSREFGLIDPVREEKQYLGELKDILKVTDGFDVVFFPVDGRIGNGYTRGARQFIERFRVGTLIPMHFVASGFESAWRMKEFTEPKGIGFWCIGREGEILRT